MSRGATLQITTLKDPMILTFRNELGRFNSIECLLETDDPFIAATKR